MLYRDYRQMTVHVIGIDKEGRVEYAKNSNLGMPTSEEGVCGYMHAEIRLLKKMPNPVTVMVSHAPCLNCAKALVKAGVQAVYYMKPYRLKDGLEYLYENGVLVYCTEINREDDLS
jgi:deoxycytidylate deaminase